MPPNLDWLEPPHSNRAPQPATRRRSSEHGFAAKMAGGSNPRAVPIGGGQFPSSQSPYYRVTGVSSSKLVQQALHHGRFGAFRRLDEANTLHRVSSPEAANRGEQIEIASNPIRHDRL